MSPQGAKIGDEVVILVDDQEVMGRVSRVTPRGIEISFSLRLPAGSLGTGLGHATWRNGRESLFSLTDVRTLAQATVVVDPDASPPEQRSYIRLEKRLAVDVALENPDGSRELATGSTCDLSTEGARLKLNRGLKKGECVHVTLHFDEGAIATPADVLRDRALEDGTHDVAVKFNLPPGEERMRLVRYVFARMRTSGRSQRS